MTDVAPPIADPSLPLDQSLPSSSILNAFGDYLSQIDVTPDGLHFAFIRLEASKKEIQVINDLQNYPHLRIIDLSENQISNLSPGLDVQAHLMYLNASTNKLVKIENVTFAEKKGLKVLDLSNNELEECQVTHWPSLLTLNLNKNKLNTLTIEDAPHLTQAEVRGNQLLTLHLNNLPKLEKLYLGANQLVDLEFLRNKPSLSLLHLRENKIQSLPSNLDENLSLAYLNLRNNLIENFEELEKLKPFVHLKKLVLLENPLTEQPSYRLNIIYRLPQLKTLDKEPIRDDEREEAEKLRLENERLAQEKLAKEKEEAEAAAAEALKQQQEEEEAARRAAESEAEHQKSNEDITADKEGEDKEAVHVDEAAEEEEVDDDEEVEDEV